MLHKGISCERRFRAGARVKADMPCSVLRSLLRGVVLARMHRVCDLCGFLQTIAYTFVTLADEMLVEKHRLGTSVALAFAGIVFAGVVGAFANAYLAKGPSENNLNILLALWPAFVVAARVT